jgi:hypothetical protein
VPELIPMYGNYALFPHAFATLRIKFISPLSFNLAKLQPELRERALRLFLYGFGL